MSNSSNNELLNTSDVMDFKNTNSNQHDYQSLKSYFEYLHEIKFSDSSDDCDYSTAFMFI
jgi:hypothetical protein